ncbi:MAG: cytochrome C oxidase subunit IV family protein [Niabella sp.]
MSNHYDPTKDISPSAAYPEVSFHHHSDDATFKKRVWRTTWILSIVTIAELAIGFFIYFLHKGDPPYFFILLLKGIVCILTLAKAYYIVSVFMHLGDEIRNFMMTIVVPLLLFIWFIIAFLADGQSFKDLKNTYDKHFEETTMPAPHKAAPAETAPAKGERQ